MAMTRVASRLCGLASVLGVLAMVGCTDPLRTRTTVTGPRAVLPALTAGTQIAVKGVNARGLEGWDWARTVLQ